MTMAGEMAVAKEFAKEEAWEPSLVNVLEVKSEPVKGKPRGLKKADLKG